MKNLLFCLFALSSLITIHSCSDEDDTELTIEQKQNVVTSGDWQISRFIDDGNDETSDFSEYAFRFEENGEILAITLTGNSTGTWNIDEDGSEDDLVLNFNTSNELRELNEDWDILLLSNERIELSDGADLLDFEKR